MGSRSIDNRCKPPCSEWWEGREIPWKSLSPRMTPPGTDSSVDPAEGTPWLRASSPPSSAVLGAKFIQTITPARVLHESAARKLHGQLLTWNSRLGGSPEGSLPCYTSAPLPRRLWGKLIPISSPWQDSGSFQAEQNETWRRRKPSHLQGWGATWTRTTSVLRFLLGESCPISPCARMKQNRALQNGDPEDL